MKTACHQCHQFAVTCPKCGQVTQIAGLTDAQMFFLIFASEAQKVGDVIPV